MSLKRRIADCLADMLAFALRYGSADGYRYFVESLWERYSTPDAAVATLDIGPFSSALVPPDASDRALVERIFTAYEHASRAQSKAAEKYQPSPMWKRILGNAYADLSQSLAGRDVERFHHFLANFGSWQKPTGIEESWLVRQSAEDRTKQRHLEEKVIVPLVQWWLKFESDGRDLAALEIPRHGNLGGVVVNGHLISPGSVLSEINGRLLARFLEIERPIVGELGGGFGRLCYFLSRHLPHFCYLGFDLPETLCCASYYLIKTFPDKRFLLYGERDWDAASLEEFDFVLLPGFEIERLPDNCIDLFINENSLGEMTAAACQNYVAQICRSAHAIWHRNHESNRFTFSDGSHSLLNGEYPVSPQQFHEVVRYCDVGPLIRADRLTRDSDMFWYYYRRHRTFHAD